MVAGMSQFCGVWEEYSCAANVPTCVMKVFESFTYVNQLSSCAAKHGAAYTHQVSDTARIAGSPSCRVAPQWLCSVTWAAWCCSLTNRCLARGTMALRRGSSHIGVPEGWREPSAEVASRGRASLRPADETPSGRLMQQHLRALQAADLAQIKRAPQPGRITVLLPVRRILPEFSSIDHQSLHSDTLTTGRLASASSFAAGCRVACWSLVSDFEQAHHVTATRCSWGLAASQRCL